MIPVVSLNKSNSKSKEKTYGKILTEKSVSKDKIKRIPGNTSKGKTNKSNYTAIHAHKK